MTSRASLSSLVRRFGQQNPFDAPLPALANHPNGTFTMFALGTGVIRRRIALSQVLAQLDHEFPVGRADHHIPSVGINGDNLPFELADFELVAL